MDSETTLLFQQLDLILQNQADFAMTTDDAAAMTLAVADMKDQYLAAQAIEKDKSATKEQIEYAKNLCASIAKGVPDMTKAAISAASAFKKGDPITGSAAVMDMCAAVAPILGSVLSAGALLGAAGGPIGMLAGALFSVIGQILMMFGPKTESMIDQIENLLNRLEEEKELQDIKSAHDDILVYARSLRSAAAKLTPSPLKTPLKTSHDAEILQESIGTLKIIVKDFQPINSVTMNHFWNVMEWLKRPDRQDLDKWPEVLGVWCKSYTDLVTSTMTIALLGHSSELRKRMSEVDAHNAEVQLTEAEKASVRKDLRSLVSYADARQIEYASCNTTALGFLTQIMPVVRNRGLFFLLSGGEAYAGTGQQVIKQDQWNHFFGYTRSMSITIAREDVVAGNLNPLYHFWNLVAPHYRPSPPGTIDDIYHGRLESLKLAKPSGAAVTRAAVIRGNASEFSDIWAIPSPENKKGSYIYCADAEGQPPGLQLFKLDENDKLEKVNWWPNTKSPLSQVRVITPPAHTLPDDPDKDAMPHELLAGVDHYNSIVYGTLRSSSEIYVDRSNERCYVPAPWQTYRGIAVDPYFLWVFGPTGFTCATHASVMRSIQSKGATPPRWLRAPSLDSLLYDGEQYRGNRDEREGSIPPHPGLVDFCPCEDGTLFICLTTRKIIKDTVPYDRNYFRQEDRNALYAAVYRVDLKSQTISVEPWTRFAGGAGATQIQKLAVPCWRVFDSLRADLSARAKTATA